jgi:hypothetical protein
MACIERAERSRSQVMMVWFVPPVVVPLLVFIIVAIVLGVRFFA